MTTILKKIKEDDETPVKLMQVYSKDQNFIFENKLERSRQGSKEN